MEESYLGEIKLFAGRIAPLDWALCDGGLYSVEQPLFLLIGTTYGGDGVTNFAVPDLRGRVALHNGQGNGLSPRALGEAGGAEMVSLKSDELPAHSHLAQAFASAGTSDQVAGNFWAGSATTPQYAPGTAADALLNAQAIGTQGQGQPHENRLPYLALNYIICMQGIFPQHG